MSMRYTHLLIPAAPDFLPARDAVVRFFIRLEEVGATPVDATYSVSVPGPPRHGRNTMTGETITVPSRIFTPVAGLTAASLPSATLDDYDLLLAGLGPPSHLAPFNAFAFTKGIESIHRGKYGYEIRCSVRPQFFPMSSAAFYDPPCASAGWGATYVHPISGKTIHVAGPACSKFWIEFRLGNWLLPKMGDGVDCLDPVLLEIATNCFGTKFVQGCLWG